MGRESAIPIQRFNTRGSGADEVVAAVAWSHDGEWLITGGGDGQTGTLRVWDIGSQSIQKKTSPHKSVLSVIAVDPRGRWIATAAEDRCVKLFDWPSLKETGVIECPGAVSDLVASPDGSALMMFADGLQLVDVVSRRVTWSSRSGSPRVGGFTPDGKEAILEHYKRVVVRDVGSANETAEAQSGYITSLSASPSRRQVVFGNTTLYRWNLSSESPEILETHAPGEHSEASSVSYDGRWVASASPVNGEVLVWSERETLRLRRHDYGAYDVRFHPRRNQIATAGYDGAALIWSLE